MLAHTSRSHRFAPLPAETDYFFADKQWMINLRVERLDALVDRLGKQTIAIDTRAEWDTPETGRFARFRDPAGNEIELWGPPSR